MTYKAGVVGLGVGRQHGAAYARTEGIEVAALADVDPDARDRFGDGWGVPPDRRYADPADMLAAEPLDVVSVATPTYLHRDHVVAAATAPDGPGVVWCEKPIATSVADAEAMVAACDDAGVELMINHFRRWSPAFRTLARFVDEGALGDLRSVVAQWPAELLRNGTHCVDMILHLWDAEPRHVSGYATGETELESLFGATIDVDDCGAGGHVVMDDGGFVSIDATVPRRIPPGDEDGVVSPHDAWLRLLGTAGKMHVDASWVTDGEWRYWALEDGDHVERTLPGMADGWTVDTDAAFRAAAADVVDLLDGDGVNRCPGAEAVAVLEVIVAVFVSHYTGSRVHLPLADPLRDVAIGSW